MLSVFSPQTSGHRTILHGAALRYRAQPRFWVIEGSMASSCYLDYEGFQDSIRCIVAISDGLGDEWRLLTSKVRDP